MPGNILSGWHLIIILVIVLLLFGAPRLPKLAKSLGESMRIFRGEMRNMNDEAKEAKSSKAEQNSPQQSTDAPAADRPDANHNDAETSQR